MKRTTKTKSVRRILLTNGLFILAVLCIHSAVFASYHVPTGSMNPTILEGDLFFANKLAYRLKLPFTNITLLQWDSPARGDIIAFTYPPDESQTFTKRVIGLPGDELALFDKRIYINGKPLSDRFVRWEGDRAIFEESLGESHYQIQHWPVNTPLDNMKPMKVPEGYIFVMGDNRDNSSDSRDWGLVPLDFVQGRLVVRWLSLEPETYLPRFNRIGTIH